MPNVTHPKTGVTFPDQKHLTIKVGDRVSISAQGTRVTGTVHTANHWGDEGWFVELVAADVFGSVAYWKQYQDGGFISNINGEEQKEASLND